MRAAGPCASLSGAPRFEAVMRRGVRIRRGGITVVKMERAAGPARVGLAVGRRVGKAVVRNRVKRRLRAALAEVGLPSGADYVVTANAAAASAPFDALCGWLREAGSPPESPEREQR